MISVGDDPTRVMISTILPGLECGFVIGGNKSTLGFWRINPGGFWRINPGEYIVTGEYIVKYLALFFQTVADGDCA